MRHDIEAIREWHKAEEDYYQQPGNPEGTWKTAHADRGTLIRALDEAQAKVKGLEEALAILNAAHEFEGEPDNKKLFVSMRVADLRRARAALKETGQ